MSFRCRDTQAHFEGKPGRRFGSFARVAFRKLAILDAAACLNDLQVPPGNRLEPLRGNRHGQHSIRINDQFCICFIWSEAGAEDVITDDDGAIEVLTAPADFEATKNALEAAGLVPEVAEVTMRPENTIELSGEDAQRMQKLLDVIEDLDDTQAVYHTAEINE